MKRLHIFGRATATPGVVTPPATLNTDPLDISDNTVGLTFSFSDSASESQIAKQILESDGTTVIAEFYPKFMKIVNRKVGATEGVFDAMTAFNGTVTPVCIDFAGGCRMWGGVGAPGTTFTGTGRVGDVYLRTDGGTGTRYYLCTVAGTPGTWAGHGL